METTKLKNLESKLIQAQKMQSLGVLAAGIIQDFNNILAIITDHAEMASKKQGNRNSVIALNRY